MPKEDRRNGEIPDPENLFFYGNNTNSYSGNMDRLFAEDEMRSVPTVTEKPSPPRAKSTTHFSSAAFWKNGSESVKVGVVLSNLDEINGLSFLMCDASKKILKKFYVDDFKLEFMKDSFAVKLGSETEENYVDLKFVDCLTFLNFSITAILRSRNHIHFKLSNGTGNTQIDSSCDIRYNLTKHSFDEEGQLKLPDERKGVKTKLSKEKMKDHVVYKWLEGCTKGAHIIIKDSESSVLEVIVDKVRIAADVNEHATKQEVKLENPEKANSENLDFIESTESIKNDELASQTSSDELPQFADETMTPTPSVDPILLPVNNSPCLNLEEESESQKNPPVHDDIRDALHRIVGIELDRIEMRLNTKFEQLQNNINSRLDKQAEILQKILEKSSSN